MSANQKPDYRPTPVTQRDGSRLQNSNCRMASIATGLDFDTLGEKKSTGARMRSHQNDQDGGTDSLDAKRAWADGYAENLDIQDGKSWSDALSDLKRFRLVHLDVWHATVGGPCLSGTGRYGHTIVVAPDCVDNEWLVSDPWCSPAKWSRVSEAKLRAGAEEWGRRVYGSATSGPGASKTPSLDTLRYIAKRLMSRYHPGDDGEEDPSEDPGDTGGTQRVMYTATTPHAPVVTPPPTGGQPTVGIYYNPGRWTLTKDLPVYLDTTGALKITTLKAGSVITSLGTKAVQEPAGGNGQDSTWRAVVVKTTALVLGDSPALPAILWCKDADMPADSTPSAQAWDDSIWALFNDPAGRYPCPPVTEPPPVVDCAAQVATAVEARDTQWREWTLEGSPGQRQRSTMAGPVSVDDDDGDVT